jgi:hypothetical protein
MKIKNWIACVQDGGKWKEVVGKAKTFTRNFSTWKKKKKKNLWSSVRREVKKQS